MSAPTCLIGAPFLFNLCTHLCHGAHPLAFGSRKHRTGSPASTAVRSHAFDLRQTRSDSSMHLCAGRAVVRQKRPMGPGSARLMLECRKNDRNPENGCVLVLANVSMCLLQTVADRSPRIIRIRGVRADPPDSEYPPWRVFSGGPTSREHISAKPGTLRQTELASLSSDTRGVQMPGRRRIVFESCSFD